MSTKNETIKQYLERVGTYSEHRRLVLNMPQYNNLLKVANELEEENEALRKSVEELRARWDSLKDIFQVTIDHNEDDEDIDLYFCRAVIKDMNKLENKSTFDSRKI